MYLQSLPILLPVLSLQELPVLELTADDTRITESVRIVIPEGLVIADVNGNGVLHVVADDVRILFTEGSVLNGASPRLLPDQYTGVGVRVEGQSGLRIEGLRVRGFKAGVYATQANGLAIDRADVTDNFAERLRSTPTLCDDGSDWLHCHDNENNEWLQNYGAGIYIEDSRGVSVTRSRARRTQNGCLLDAVTDALVSDCDFSFLSGWGLGLWRTSDSIIAHNAFDFCIRGYSHGVYNRGQDSAGILVFEQCSNNAFVDNSATHGGDGIFGFAGREALGERASEGDGFDATRLGNNDNLFRGNDLSYAAAHGLEMTFSFGNRVMNNSFAGNAICGIWGGYSQGMLIHDNWFDSNGDAGYGLERGGVNIEHSMDNWIVRNAFTGNKCGVHLWWDEDVGLMKSAWAKANIAACSGNGVVGNRFTGDQVALHLRTCEPVAFADNTMVDVGVEVDGADGCTAPADPAVIPPCTAVVPEAMGTSPVGARKHLAGRENIIMG
ncbi:MAG: nitrous oxidase accessory protein NosD, partial [Planctomycetota bacterium]